MLRRAATVGWKWPKRASQVLKKSFESIFVSRGKAKLSDDQQKTSKMRYATFWKQWSTYRFARNQICSLTSLHLRLDVPLKKEQVACPRTRRCTELFNFLPFRSFVLSIFVFQAPQAATRASAAEFKAQLDKRNTDDIWWRETWTALHLHRYSWCFAWCCQVWKTTLPEYIPNLFLEISQVSLSLNRVSSI